MNPYLDELLSRPTRLPTVPAVVQQVLASFGEAEVSLGEIGRRISLDPVIAAKLLRLANSAYYRARREIRSVDEALQLLGLTTVRNVVLGCGLKETFAPVPGLDLRGLWRHGVRTACAARWLGRELRLDAEFAFTVSLMLGIGELLIHRALPERARQIDAVVGVTAPGRAALEQRALHFHFADASAALAERWTLPASLCTTLAAVPDPLGVQPWDAVAACVHLAGWAAWCQHDGASASPLAGGGPPVTVASALSLTGAWWPEDLPAPARGTPEPPRARRMPGFAELTAGLEDLLA